MKVHELISRLEALNPDAELRFAYQANYPVQDKVDGVWTSEETSASQARVVYIVSAGQDSESPYAPRAAFQEAW